MTYYENTHIFKLLCAQNPSQSHGEAILFFYSMSNSGVYCIREFCFVYFQGDSETRLVVFLILKSNTQPSGKSS